jgi:hypothetical protein
LATNLVKRSFIVVAGIALAGFGCGHGLSTSDNSTPGTGGGAGGSGGTGGNGGAVTTGGATLTGSTVAFDGGSTSIEGGASYDAPPSTSGCSCAEQTTTLDCYCQAFGCTGTLAAYGKADGGANFSAIMEYANCNLVAVEEWTATGSYLWQIYDMTTGSLVGAEAFFNTFGMRCPFGSDGGNLTALRAGQVRDASCVRSKCVEGDAVDSCMTGNYDGGRPRD